MGTKITVASNDSGVLRVNKLGITSYAERKLEPQTQNTFAFQFLFDPGQVAYIATSANKQISPISGAEEISTNHAEGLAQINEYLNSSMQSVGSPSKTVAQIAIDFFNTQIKYAGKPTYSNANITLNTLIGLGTKNILSAWSDICLNDRTLRGGWARTEPNYVVPQRGGMSADEYLNTLFSHIGYKCDGVLLECARDGSVVNQWDYIGMWVQNFTPGSYTMAGANSPSQITATLSVDKIQQSEVSYTSSNLNNYNVNR